MTRNNLPVPPFKDSIFAKQIGRSDDMTDQELVRLAAKAQGVHLDEKLTPWFTYSDAGGFQWLSNDGRKVQASYNPLHNMGDAGNMAADLEIGISFGSVLVGAHFLLNGAPTTVTAEIAGNRRAAAMRAVVEAAAVLGGAL